MDEIFKIKTLYGLKNVQRQNSVQNRKESTAEHSWSCLILADYFLSKTILSLDRLKIYELLMYHDVVEIETGDICITDEQGRRNKAACERAALKVMKEKFPSSLVDKYVALFEEYNLGQSDESKFAKAIDALDPVIHEMDYKDDWKGWTADFLRDKKGKYFEPFPVMKEYFEQLLNYLEDQGYFTH